MNFLAHLYLSGNDDHVRIGNFIGDFVKGRIIREHYLPGIAKGLELHRAIDYFTDLHPVVRESKNRLRPKYGHFSGIIVDMFYDHFLAKNWAGYSPLSLADFAAHTYRLLHENEAVLPQEVKHLVTYMQRDNWLLNYARLEGIDRALTGMSRRTKHVSKMDEATADLRAHYASFEEEFKRFFPQLQEEVATWIRKYPEV